MEGSTRSRAHSAESSATVGDADVGAFSTRERASFPRAPHGTDIVDGQNALLSVLSTREAIDGTRLNEPQYSKVMGHAT